ncbi:MAG: PEGA domain-containing protein [Polyangiales bacterium]
MRRAALLLALIALGCAKRGTIAAEPARLKIVASPPNASVYVDGHYFGRATVLSEEPKALVPGAHLLTVQADDHFPHDMEIDLPSGVTTIAIDLRPIPP